MGPLLNLQLKFRNFAAYVRELGWSAALVLSTRSLRPGRLLTLRIASLPHPFVCRPEVVDIGVVRAVIGHRESLVEIDRPRIIIDAGGHIGTSTVVFAAHYPEARVVTLEPDTSNFTLLQQNTAHYPNVLPMQSALWSRDESLQIQNPAAASYSYQVGVNTTNPTTKVPGLSLQTLLDQIAAPSCDLLKLDIEGAEFEVMRDTPPEIWQRIKVVVIELHERIRPGVKALADTTFPASRWTRNEQGEYLILRQK